MQEVMTGPKKKLRYDSAIVIKTLLLCIISYNISKKEHLPGRKLVYEWLMSSKKSFPDCGFAQKRKYYYVFMLTLHQLFLQLLEYIEHA